MANVKAKLRTSKVENKMGVIYYQIIHSRIVRHISTDYTVYPHEWDSKSNLAIIDESDPKRANQLKFINDKIGVDIRRFNILATTLDSKGQMCHCDDLISAYIKQPKNQTFFNYFRTQITRLKELGKHSTCGNYTSAYNSFYKFRDGNDFIFDNLTSELIEEYEVYLKRKNISTNSISFYMRTIRAVYNKAVDKGIVEQCHPFRKVYTGIEKTTKRALSINDIKRIKKCNLNSNTQSKYARDMFLFSFYTRGMSFIDMAYLKKSDIKNGVLSYRRCKTGQLLHIKWEKCMQDIVNHYQNDDSIYLLPIIENIVGEPNEHNLYKGKLYNVNTTLKTLTKILNLPLDLTMYVARHSWASAARTKNIPISVISEGMGHNNEATTQIYLASINTTVIDDANNLILSSL